MAIEYRIDHDRQIVFAKTHGVMTDQDVFGYQRDVWSRPELAGYNELMDMSDVEGIETPSSTRLRELAALSAKMDPTTLATKFAIVAPGDLAFGFGRMYQTYRELNDQGTKKVAVFRSMAEAIKWLETDESAS